jgi:NADH-quinone oxidoreductase subunit L
MFHLFTHAFFKALLFLGAGSVILGVHHEQDMRKMGGLWNKLPWTYAVMLIGTIAITGMGIPGVELGFAGFYSKDAIINAAYVAGQHNGVAYFAFLMGLFAAGLTAFYSWRLIFMTFHGTPKWGHDDHAHVEGHDDHGHGGHDDHGHGGMPHESPWTMRLPLLVLSVGAIFAGGVFAKAFIGEGREAFWRGAIFTAPSNHVLAGIDAVPAWVVAAPLALSIAGLVGAFYVYVLNEGMGERIAERRGPLWILFYNKWFFDEIYDAIFVKGAKALGDLFWKVGDQTIIDGGGPNGFAAISAFVGRLVGRWQTGYVYTYAFVMLLGVAGLLTYALVAWPR